MNVVDVAHVISAFATAGALIFVGLQAVYSRNAADAARRMLELESDRDVRAMDREARRRASQVTTWPVKLKIASEEKWGVVINNASPSPVFDLELRRSEGRAKSGKLIPSLFARAAVIPPGRYAVEPDQKIVLHATEFSGDVAITGNADYMAEMRFRDSNGRSWGRDNAGMITQTTEEESR